MNRAQRWLLILAILLLGIGEVTWRVHLARVEFERFTQEMQVRARASQPPLPQMPLFTRADAYAFLAKAKRAEALTDPLQRCLAYPDPPGSHWAHDAVAAYCHYRYQPIPSFAEAQRLIQSGQAAKLDRLLADALKAQQSDPDAPGRLDHIYEEDFYNGSFDVRSTLDAWKRESPNSAFAWAASGDAYVAMAQKARGSDYISNTPQSSIDAIDKLLSSADTDLRHAITLDPHVTPAYVAMIDAGGFSLGHDYALSAVQRGLAIAPDNFGIRDTLMWINEPKWYGSLPAMRRFADESQMYAAENPLLKLLVPDAALYKVDNCDCNGKVELAAYRAALDQLARAGHMRIAGNEAKSNGDAAMMAIYLSESLRFNQGQDDIRIERTYDLVDFDEASWAEAEAGRVIADSSRDIEAFRARAHAYESTNDYAHAEKDLQSALAIDPGDIPSLSTLGDIYVHWTHQWDKGWAIANRMIEANPYNVYGWMLRADIQKGQPRKGLSDTADYIATHFANQPGTARLVTRLRAAAALQQGRTSGAPAAKAPSHS